MVRTQSVARLLGEVAPARAAITASYMRGCHAAQRSPIGPGDVQPGDERQKDPDAARALDARDAHRSRDVR